MGWHERIIYHRDFAYDSSRRRRMANGSIGDVPAATYAEYVDDPFLDSPACASGDASQTSSDDEDDDVSGHAPRADAPQTELAQTGASAARCIALRPALAHRLYSHQLHVRAKAKLHRDRLLSGSMIDVYVGESKRHWSLHRNLLCHHSESLEEELDGAAHGSEKTDRLDLPSYDPAGFELLVKWLYQGTLDDVSDMVDASQKYDYAVSCYKLYLLCDRFDMAQLKNVAMDQYRKGLNEAELVPDADEIDDIYRNSPPSSPFRQLMTRIAARQIMDPASERDVETYRQCFENNPDFALDLVKAIRHGTGGVLFEDPTDPGHECEYHDHEAGPNCHAKGKGKLKSAKKTRRPQPDHTSAREAPESRLASSDQLRPLPRPPPNPARPIPPLAARLPERTSAGPLRRRLTSPASSTVGTSRETVVASRPPSPDMTRDRERDRERLRKVTPPERRRQAEQVQVNGTETREQSHPVPDAPHQSSEGMSHLSPPSEHPASGVVEGMNGISKTPQQAPSHGLWNWARAGTGRLSIIGRLPHPQWNGPASSKAMADLTTDTLLSAPMASTQDDFSLPSTTTTHPNDAERQNEAAAAKLEGLGITDVSILASPHFSQTKRSSDDLVAASSTASTPANMTLRTEGWENGTPARDSPPATPETPTPQQKKKPISPNEERTPTRNIAVKSVNGVDNTEPEDKGHPVQNAAATATAASNDKPTDNVSEEDEHAQHRTIEKPSSEDTGSPRPISKLKIALAPNLLSPARNTVSS